MYIKIRSVGILKARKRTLIWKKYTLDKIKKIWRGTIDFNLWNPRPAQVFKHI